MAYAAILAPFRFLRCSRLLIGEKERMRRQSLRRSSALLCLAAIIGGCTNVGCCLTFAGAGTEGSQHVLVIGLGVISLPPPSTEPAAMVTKVESVGVVVSDQPATKLSLGYSKTTVIAVPDGAEDVRLEVSDEIGGPIRIDAPSAKLRASNQNSK